MVNESDKEIQAIMSDSFLQGFSKWQTSEPNLLVRQIGLLKDKDAVKMFGLWPIRNPLT